MGKKVSLITFHGSHNFGSVMQAYALKAAVKGLGYDCSIVNFRPTSQRDKYSLFPIRYGFKFFAKSALHTILHPYRRLRTAACYEDFIARYLTDEQEINTMDGLKRIDSDVLLTGSDQVWGYQIPEFMKSEEDVRPAYYYSFSEGRKVSYASSTGTATVDQLAPYAPLISRYSRISVREQNAVSLISELSGKQVDCVLDPTFLLNEDDYRHLLSTCNPLHNPPEGEYCLIYSLQGFRARAGWLELAQSVRESLGMPTVSVSHFMPLVGAGISPILDVGPIDVLSLFKNARLVLTDTFHGTLFATHFHKQFIVFMPGREDPRINDISSRLGFEDRVVHSTEEATAAWKNEVNYTMIESFKRSELTASRAYLSEALKG